MSKTISKFLVKFKMKRVNFKLFVLIFFIFLVIPLTVVLFPALNYNPEILITPKTNNLKTSATNTWIANGTAICTESTDEQWDPQICSDGTGGAIITWVDGRGFSDPVSTMSDIYAQRVDSDGNEKWTKDGVTICKIANWQTEAQICSDGAEGAIIIWQDLRSGTDSDVYAQKIDSNGNVQWTPNGVAICTANDYQQSPIIYSDGAGGAIITWNDPRNGLDFDIYAQRIDSNGDIQWTPNGVAICTASNDQNNPQICSDGSGGAIITWDDDRGASEDIYAQHVNSLGNVQWIPNGRAISTANDDQFSPQICSDESGGAIISWVDDRDFGDGKIYAQKVNSSGDVQWTIDGVAICTISDLIWGEIQMCSDEVGGVLITWRDGREGSEDNIYAQRFDLNGNVNWATNGVPICNASDFQYGAQICSDGVGGAIITWEDLRNGMSDSDIYAQKVNSSGDTEWINDGIGVCTGNLWQFNPQICSDGAGGAIITWNDGRYGNSDLFAQKIDSNGITMWDVNGTLIKAFYDVLEIKGIREDIRVGIFGYSSIQPFFFALSKVLDIFPNIFVIGIHGSGKTTFTEILFNFLFGTKMKSPDSIDSPARITKYSTESTFTLHIDDIDDLEEKLMNFIKTSSTRKGTRDRLTRDQKLLSEQTYASYTGTANNRNFLAGNENDAFRKRCLIFETMEGIDIAEDTAIFEEERFDIAEGKIVGFYLLEKAIEFFKSLSSRNITVYFKLISHINEIRKRLKKKIIEKKNNNTLIYNWWNSYSVCLFRRISTIFKLTLFLSYNFFYGD